MLYEWVMQFRKYSVLRNHLPQRKFLEYKNLYRDLFDEMEAKFQ